MQAVSCSISYRDNICGILASKLTQRYLAAMMLTIFSPAVTLIIYVIQAELRGARSIDVNLAFTSLAIISMVTNPANSLLTISPHVATNIAAFDRIQKYLNSPDRQDKRETPENKYANNASYYANDNVSTYPRDGSAMQTDNSNNQNFAISIGDATIRPASTADPVLKGIDTTIQKGTLIVCSGAVGTGKTTFARALLGDLPPDTGTIEIAFGSIAYCAQTAWMINGTIQEIIRGPASDESEVDEAWYKRVVHACDLEEDLHQLPDGDQTIVGSRGITLSGGQKQRVVSELPPPEPGVVFSDALDSNMVRSTGSGACSICAPGYDHP
jgi:ATP-binding cassette subfamily C (CFTR/MRP) protein 1